MTNSQTHEIPSLPPVYITEVEQSEFSARMTVVTYQPSDILQTRFPALAAEQKPVHKGDGI